MKITLPSDLYKIHNYKIVDHFKNHFGRDPDIVVKSPGRINIIGEHTDYHGGYALPAAIDYHIFFAVGLSRTNNLRIYSIDYQDEFASDRIRENDLSKKWVNLIYRVIDKLNGNRRGLDISFGGNLPDGVGLSSSAAICCGIATALSKLFNINIEKWEIVKLAQKAEYDFTKVQGGISGQFACMFSMTNQLLMLDCKTLLFEPIENSLSGYKFLLINTRIRNKDRNKILSKRQEETRRALNAIKRRKPHVKTIRDLTTGLLEDLRDELNPQEWHRAFHVTQENCRVLQMQDHLKNSNYVRAGQLLTKSHLSLKNFYEVTCAETDFLVDLMLKEDNVLGARQMGPGLGGCVLVLVKDSQINEMIIRVQNQYRKKHRVKLSVIPIKLGKGCHVVG